MCQGRRETKRGIRNNYSKKTFRLRKINVFMTNVNEILKKYIIFRTSERQAVIKLIEKKGNDKRFIKNWRPI